MPTLTTGHVPTPIDTTGDDPFTALLDELVAVTTRPRPLTRHDLIDSVVVIDQLAAADRTAASHRDRAALITALAALTTTTVGRYELATLVRLTGFTGTWLAMLNVLIHPADLTIHRIDPHHYAADLIRAADPANRVIWFAVIAAELGCSTWQEPAGSDRSSRDIHDDHTISVRRHQLTITSELADILDAAVDPDRVTTAKQMFAVIANDNGAIATDLYAAAHAAHTLATM